MILSEVTADGLIGPVVGGGTVIALAIVLVRAALTSARNAGDVVSEWKAIADRSDIKVEELEKRVRELQVEIDEVKTENAALKLQINYKAARSKDAP